MSDVKYKKRFLSTSPHHITLRNFKIMAIEKLAEKEKRKTRIIKTTLYPRMLAFVAGNIKPFSISLIEHFFGKTD